jgi:SAM-dependent methyltransferase
MDFGQRFFETYAGSRPCLRIIDIGAQDVNGSLRPVAPADAEYVGVDFVAGKGVDVIISDPYALPFPDESADLVVCSSCMEHSEFFWLLFNEMIRVLKPDGVLYINAPSNGAFHRYPVDCWRFYPDSGIALRNWSRRSGYRTALLESFTGPQVAPETWNDFVGVFLKDEAFVASFPRRILDEYPGYTNGLRFGEENLTRLTTLPEDQRLRPGPKVSLRKRIKNWLLRRRP